MTYTTTLFISTFITIFIAELGDKTQLATMAISGSSQKPMAVFIGSSIALVLATAIGVLLGGTFSSLIPSYIIEFIAAIGFLIIGISLWIAAPGEET